MMVNENFEKDLVHCIYASGVAKEFSTLEIEELLSKAREKNARLGVTGILLFEGGSFFQVLEGDAETIKKLYKTIRSDSRHQRITKLIFEPIKTREFADWSMGLAVVSMKKLNKIEGLNDFFRDGKCFTDLDEGRVKKLLEAFKEGRWRTTITA
ncbi:MAG: BLUF domain-containing protein [Gammaproteobacteria bacterium]